MPTLFSGYCSATDVKTAVITDILATLKTAWADTDIETRITEADTLIDSELKEMGFTVPFSSVPPLIKVVAVYLSRFLVLRDLFRENSRSGVISKEDRLVYEDWKKDADAILNDIRVQKKTVVDSTGLPVMFDPNNLKVLTNSADIPRTLTMGEDSAQGIDAKYSADAVLGNP